MPGLILKLSPGDRFVANGVVIENGDRRARLNILTPNSRVLRLRDAIHPDEANTPVRRVCYIAQLVLAGEATVEEATPQIELGIRQLSAVFADGEGSAILGRAGEALADGKFYPVLRTLQTLMPLEEELMQIAGRG